MSTPSSQASGLEPASNAINPEDIVAARDLATYLIPGCVGRGVRLGSESSSGGGGGGGVWKFGVQKIKKTKFLKIQIRSAQNVGKVWISRKKSSWPYFGPSEAIFSIGQKNRKNAKILPISLGGPMGPIHPVWTLAAIHPRWGNRYSNWTKPMPQGRL